MTILLLFSLTLLLSILVVPSTGAAETHLTTASQKTGTDVTLMSVYFRDANLGWAVGSGGTVL
ncbi:MAG TPA: hypothetical protein VLA99_12610, partial [Nitrospiraceae bacterium]|nr:hypothetical protein [Nitrospiraceae bacterium]